MRSLTAVSNWEILVLLAMCVIALAACSGGGGGVLPTVQSPLPTAALVEAGALDSTAQFVVRGAAGAVAPGALVTITDPASNATTVLAQFDGSFSTAVFPIGFDSAVGTVLDITQTASGMLISAAVSITIAPIHDIP